MVVNPNPSSEPNELPDVNEKTAQQPDTNDNDNTNDNTNDNDDDDDGNDAPEGPRKNGSAMKKKLNAKKGPPGGFDTTPLPSAPPGYTVRFGFRSASNLPPADINTGSSDPFLIATLRAANPKRHKEEPDLTYRTRTLRRTTEPEWNEEWTVANVPPSGFSLKCRMYDEDTPDQNDRLGNVTIRVSQVFENWEGFKPPGKQFGAKKRMISKRAFVIKACTSMFKKDVHMTPLLCISIEVLGKSEPPYAQMCTLGPTVWIKHFSPMIGRLAGTKVNADEEDDQDGGSAREDSNKDKSQKYDFQANQMQLAGPVPSKLYHRYVEFRPVIGSMFASTGLRGKVLNAALHKQHDRIYNFDRSTESDKFEPCSEDAAMQFLKLAHFDEGGRVFTYVLTLDGIFRFTETGKEFGIDLLSKHTMHSNVQTYIACSGEFFIRRLEHPDASEETEPNEKTHPKQPIPGGPPYDKPPHDPSYYQLIIDNDSGTYRPDKSILPNLKEFLEKNFPGLGVIAMHWEEEELKKLKEDQKSAKKKEGKMINVVMNRSQSSISSAESELAGRDGTWENGKKSKRETAFSVLEDPKKMKAALGSVMPGGGEKGESSK